MSAADVYKKTRKVPDLWWNAYVCRPLAAVLVALVQGTRLTPNQITLGAVFVCLGGALVWLWVPGYAGLVLGALLFELSYVLDCADGMLARWRETASPTGHLLDFLMDEIKAFVVLAAVAVRLFLERADVRILFLGLFGLVCLASGIALTTFLRRPEIVGPTSTVARPTAGLLGLVERLAKFVIHYPSYIWLAALLGRIEYYFVPYIAVNALYAARTFLSVGLRFGRSA